MFKSLPTCTAGLPLVAVLALLPMAVVAATADGFDCLIEPNMVVDISSAVEGVVERVHVERSDIIQQGELLVELDAGVEIAAVNKARAQAEMTGELNARRSSLEFAERRQKRIKQLFKQGLLPSHDMDEAQTQVRLAAAELHKAEETQRLAMLELQRAEETLKLRRIRSPIQGVVVERYKSPGESVEDKPIMKLAQLDPLRVEAFLPASRFGEVKTGLYARVKLESSTPEDYLAEVTLVDRIIDAASGTYSVRLQLPNPEHKIPSGLRCRVTFLTESESARIRAQQPVKPEPAERTSSSIRDQAESTTAKVANK